MKNRVLLLGLDGASPDLLRKWMENGSLPNLASMRTRGIFGKLRTTIPSQSAPAWASLYTGMNPGKHGVYGFVDKRRRLISSVTIKGRKLWQILSNAGLRCCIINAPLTYPPEKINGYMISSWLSPTHKNRRYTYPGHLVKRLEAKGYKLYPDLIKVFKKSSYGRPPPEQMFQNREALLPEYYDLLEKKKELAKDLLSEESWDLFFLVITETDAVQHLFYDKKAVLENFFHRVDQVVGSLLKVFREREEDGFFMLVSDHGFGSYPSRCINLRSLLPKREGISGFWNMAYRFKPFVDKLYGIIPWIMKPTLRTAPPPIRVRDAGIYIQKTLFTPESYEKLRTHIISRLLDLRDEKGLPVFREVWRKEELYQGLNLEEAPDIAYLPREDFTLNLLPQNTGLFREVNAPLPGTHHAHPFGTMMIEGPEIMREKQVYAKITDILPTVLYIFGIPISKEIDGRVLLEAFTNRFLSKKPVRYEDIRKEPKREGLREEVYTEEEEKEIKRRLQSLGYL